jgi:hypothetical protein
MVLKAAGSPETTTDVNQIRQGYIPENIIYNHRVKNIKSHSK